MFLLIFGGHIGAPKLCTNMASPYKALQRCVKRFGKYRIYSINRPGRLLNFWTLRVGAYSKWALIRGWALIKFSPF